LNGLLKSVAKNEVKKKMTPERKAFLKNLKASAKIVESWPKWKKEQFGLYQRTQKYLKEKRRKKMEDNLNKAFEAADKKVVQGLDLKVTETDTILAKYAALPITDTSVRYLVQVLEPVPLVPMIKKIDHDLYDRWKSTTLETLLLEEWKAHYSGQEDIIGKDHWVYRVKEVKLIECDLLVPRKEKNEKV